MAFEALSRCDEAATFTEEAGKVTRTFLSEPMLRLHEPAGRLDGSRRAARALDAAGNMVGRYAGIEPGLARADDRLAYRHRPGCREIRRRARASCSASRPSRRSAGDGCRSASTSWRSATRRGCGTGVPFLGSMAACGRFDRGLLDRTDADGIAMADAFRVVRPGPVSDRRSGLSAGRLLGYLEAHIEQGPVLETWGRRSAWSRRSPGSAGSGPSPRPFGTCRHLCRWRAGTTRWRRPPRSSWRSSGSAARPPACARRSEPSQSSRAHANVVPGLVHGERRHPPCATTTSGLQRWPRSAPRALAVAARRGVEFRVTREEHHAAVPADPGLSELLGQAVVRAGYAPHRLTSGAGHDAAVMAAIAPMAMLFLRSPGGVSHHPDERVLTEDVAVALDVMLRYLDLLADRVVSTGGTSASRPTLREPPDGPLRLDSQPRPALARADRPGQLRDLGPPGLGGARGV